MCPDDSHCIDIGDKNLTTCQFITLSRPPCADEGMSKSFQFHHCCKFVKSFSENFAATLKIMKYSVQAPHFLESVEEEARVFENISHAFGVSRYILKPTEKRNEGRRNFNSYIPLCQYAKDPHEMNFFNCDLFHRSMSNMGLSFSFNSERFWWMYQKNNYNKLFERVMVPNTEKKVIYPKSSGQNFRLRFLLNGKTYFPPDRYA